MKTEKTFTLIVFAVVLLAGVQMNAIGQVAKDGSLATPASAGSAVRFDTTVANSGGTLTISAPDGRVFRKDFRGANSLEFALTDNHGERLPDGTYIYELRLTPASQALSPEALKTARGNDDDPESVRAARKSSGVPNLVQSGSFAILNGQVIVAGSLQEPTRFDKTIDQPRGPGAGIISGNTVKRLRNHRFSLLGIPDDVIADDLIVQGSACVGLDCVNGESFGFDTIRLKENNTRISFNDTSTSAGFPTEDWTIRANSSSSGGASFLAFVDRGTSEDGTESGTIVFEVDAGAPANALRVSSVGKVGIRTATPVLDLHITGTDTPAIRQEQTSGGGFTAQTWDIGANEANWFVRDVTGGSRLPLRIRPGAPTSSIDISASGNVGIGTASPSQLLHVHGNTVADIITNIDNSLGRAVLRLDSGGTSTTDVRLAQAGSDKWSISANGSAFFLVRDETAATYRLAIDNTGRVGIATTAPTATLSVNGTANKPGGGSWDVFSDERLKNIKGPFTPGLNTLLRLQPLRYRYKANNELNLPADKEYVGFGAGAIQKVLPEAVSENANGYLQINNDPILWTMLNAIKEQQKEIAELKGQIRQLQIRSRRHRR